MEGWSEKGGMQRADASVRRHSAEPDAAAHSCVTTPQILSVRSGFSRTCQKQSLNLVVPQMSFRGLAGFQKGSVFLLLSQLGHCLVL